MSFIEPIICLIRLQLWRLNHLILVILLIHVQVVASSDEDFSDSQGKTSENTRFIDFIVTKDHVIGINTENDVLVFDLNSLTKIKMLSLADIGDEALSIHSNRQGDVYIGTAEGSVYSLDLTKYELNLFLETEEPVIDIAFWDGVYLAQISSVTKPQDSISWDKFKHPYSGYVTYIFDSDSAAVEVDEAYFPPEFSLVDSYGRWWLLKNYGEWGGMIQILDLRSDSIYSNYYAGLIKSCVCPKSIFQDQNEIIYIVSDPCADVFVIDSLDSAQSIFKIEDYWPADDSAYVLHHTMDSSGVFKISAPRRKLPDYSIHCGNFNPFDSLIYLMTDIGMIRGSLDHSSRKLEIEETYISQKQWDEWKSIGKIERELLEFHFVNDSDFVFYTRSENLGIFRQERFQLFRQ